MRDNSAVIGFRNITTNAITTSGQMNAAAAFINSAMCSAVGLCIMGEAGIVCQRRTSGQAPLRAASER